MLKIQRFIKHVDGYEIANSGGESQNPAIYVKLTIIFFSVICSTFVTIFSLILFIPTFLYSSWVNAMIIYRNV
jgi:hypothetical protein